LNYTITNGNTTSFQSKDENGAVTGSGTAVFDMSHTNSISNAQMGRSFLGVSDNNLMVSGTGTYSGFNATLAYQYTFDSNGKISTSTFTATAFIGTFSQVSSYTYY
jgi:hypothetical protein